MHQDITHAAISIFRVRAGRVISSRSWMIDLANLPEDSSLLDACINRVYQDFEIGKEILVNQEIDGDALA
ncbi:hypothetical protein, partial [Acinetobacter baylyi]|uniref:hypothetical protein n=1 Tax=Acinetobacter baylyi TaxID=202950 RepID=UPI003EC08A6A